MAAESHQEIFSRENRGQLGDVERQLLQWSEEQLRGKKSIWESR